MYTVKGYVPKNNGRRAHVAVLVEATGCMDAMTIATQEFGLEDITAVALSPVKETIAAPLVADKEPLHFIATASTVPASDEEKEQKYQICVLAYSFDDAKAAIAQQLQQGYDMELAGLKKVNLYAVKQ